MDANILTERGWKAIVQKFKIKDDGLQKALANYEVTNDSKPGDGAKTLATVIKFATNHKKEKEITANALVAKYLTDMLAAAAAKQKDLAKDQAEADKNAALSDKKAQDEKRGANAEGNEQEDQEGNYAQKLLAAFQKLKSSKELVYEFIVCDAKPHCGLMVAQRISSQHKELLTKLTGSNHFLHAGTCRIVDGKFSFAMGQPVTGLAKKLQDSIKNFTGKRLPIVVGSESAEADDQPAGGPAAASAAAGPIPPPKLGQPTLARAPEVWHGTRSILDANINHLKQAVRNEYAGESPAVLSGIEETVSKLDVILEKLDRRLADSLAKAGAAPDAGARQAELKNSKAILADYLKYVKSEPLIAHVDANPLGIQTNIRQVLIESLTHMAQAIG